MIISSVFCWFLFCVAASSWMFVLFFLPFWVVCCRLSVSKRCVIVCMFVVAFVP